MAIVKASEGGSEREFRHAVNHLLGALDFRIGQAEGRLDGLEAALHAPCDDDDCVRCPHADV